LSEIHGGMPPRRTRRLQRKKQKLSLKSLIQSGLVLFGTLFFGLIAWELYHANQEPGTASRSAAADGTQALKLKTEVLSEPAEQETASEKGSEPKAKNLSAQDSATAQATTPAAQSGQTASSASSQSEAQAKTVSSDQPEAKAGNQATATPAQASASSSAAQSASTAEGKAASSAAKPQAGGQKEGAQAKPKVVRHVVQKGDTLYKLSRQYYGNNSGVARIARYNGFSPDTQLVVGKVVLIPLSSE